MKPMLQRIYVAGPYTKGDVVVNVRAAVLAGNQLRDLGFTPFIPHLSHLWHTISPRPYEYWLAMDLEWLDACHALLRLPGESKGADMEVTYCLKNGIAVFHDINALLRASEEIKEGKL